MKIRKLITELLKSNNIAGGRIYPQRPDPFYDTEYPCVFVNFGQEQSESSESNDNYKNDAVLNINIVHGSKENLEDILDRLEWEVVSTILKRDVDWPEWVEWVKYSGSQPYQNEDDGEVYRGVSLVTFSIRYDFDIIEPFAAEEFLSFGTIIETNGGAISEINQTIRSS